MTRAESILFPTAQGAASLGTWRRNSRVLGSITLTQGLFPLESMRSLRGC